MAKRKVGKLVEFKRLLKDPEVQELMRELLNSQKDNVQPDNNKVEQKPEPVAKKGRGRPKKVQPVAQSQEPTLESEFKNPPPKRPEKDADGKTICRRVPANAEKIENRWTDNGTLEKADSKIDRLLIGKNRPTPRSREPVKETTHKVRCSTCNRDFYVDNIEYNLRYRDNLIGQDAVCTSCKGVARRKF